jgi:D-hydroxyproline dehydrogenase subunit gamma
MPDLVVVQVNGRSLQVPDGTSAAAAICLSGQLCCRSSVSGEPRAPLCGMGICFECRATVNGQPHRRTCQLLVADGMVIETSC